MDWLKLTTSDIDEAWRLARTSSPMPAVLKIGVEDLLSAGPEQSLTQKKVLQITDADLRAARPQRVSDDEISAREQLMFRLINQARRDHLPGWLINVSLKWHQGLAAVARGHSLDMLQRQYVEHDSPEGLSASNRIERFGIRYLACGENIGVVYGANSHSEQGIHDIHHAFMDQPRGFTNHRGNVLNPIWTHVGVGGAYKPDGTLIITQNYMSAPGVR